MDTDPSFREFVPVDYDESWQNLLENCFKDLQRYPSTAKVFHRKPAEKGGFILLGVKNDGTFMEGFTIDNSKRSALRDSVDNIEPQVDCDIYPLTVSGREIWVMDVKEGKDKPYFCSGAVHVRRGAAPGTRSSFGCSPGCTLSRALAPASLA